MNIFTNFLQKIKAKRVAIIFISTMLVIITLIATPFIVVFSREKKLPKVYNETYLAAVSDKYDRLQKIKEPKIVLVGGSNLPFGIRSDLLEKELNMPIVNFGLYAALGSKTPIDLMRKHIRKDDIVIFVPEYDGQMFSTALNHEIVLQMLETNPKMRSELSIDDSVALVGREPEYNKKKQELLVAGNTKPAGIYARSSFNKYGDIKVNLRPYNIMVDGFDSSTIVDPTSDFVSKDFIKYFNEFADELTQVGAKVCTSFAPVNRLAIKNTCTPEQRLKYYDFIRQEFHSQCISNMEDYILDEGYFYDTNYHLNDSGAIYRSVYLINDIKRLMKIYTATDIDVPAPSGFKPTDPIDPFNPSDPTNPIDENYFVYETTKFGITITGTTETGKAQSSIKIPNTINNTNVVKITANAFNGCNSLTTLTLPQYISAIDDGAFSNCELTIINLNPNMTSPYPPVSRNFLNGAKDSLKFYTTSSHQYIEMRGDYNWMNFSDKIILKSL